MRYRSATTSPGAKRPWSIESDEVIHERDEDDDPLDRVGVGVAPGRSGATVGGASRNVVTAQGVAVPQRGHVDADSSRAAAQIGHGRTRAL
jgi:hypothetical protein